MSLQPSGGVIQKSYAYLLLVEKNIIWPAVGQKLYCATIFASVHWTGISGTLANQESDS